MCGKHGRQLHLSHPSSQSSLLLSVGLVWLTGACDSSLFSGPLCMLQYGSVGLTERVKFRLEDGAHVWLPP